MYCQKFGAVIIENFANKVGGYATGSFTLKICIFNHDFNHIIMI